MFKISSNKPDHICVAYRCKNKRNGGDRFCSKHRHRYTKYKDPISYTYHSIKSNAKRRGKEFTITKAEFAEFCGETNYLKLKGRLRSSASIDRIDSSLGYTKDNIQILSLSINSSKGNRDNIDNDDGVPF